MQTFLPENNFVASARALDNTRLNSQLNEGARIMTALVTGKGWIHHPATKMWIGHENSFLEYLCAIKRECKARHIDYTAHWTVIQRMTGWAEDSDFPRIIRGGDYPEWWMDDEQRRRIVTTHRGRLWQKDPVFYAKYENDGKFYAETIDAAPLALVCCAARRKEKGIPGLLPCQYYWPTHMED